VSGPFGVGVFALLLELRCFCPVQFSSIGRPLILSLEIDLHKNCWFFFVLGAPNYGSPVKRLIPRISFSWIMVKWTMDAVGIDYQALWVGLSGLSYRRNLIHQSITLDSKKLGTLVPPKNDLQICGRLSANCW